MGVRWFDSGQGNPDVIEINLQLSCADAGTRRFRPAPPQATVRRDLRMGVFDKAGGHAMRRPAELAGTDCLFESSICSQIGLR